MHNLLEHVPLSIPLYTYLPTQATPLSNSRHTAQQLRLQNIFALLVLLARLICPVVLPPDRLLALTTCDVAHHVPAGRHVPFAGFRGGDIDDAVEEEGFAVLAAEVL